ncbi:hypothetical protein NFI96_017319 [Prochilodus magdalenae]|nr:hypothetical protein NFI96_017319 [Prochilodus magdalenae]
MLARVLIFMVLLMGGLGSALPLEAEGRNVRVRKSYTSCPAGQFVDVDKCSECPDDSYTSQVNSEHACHPCFANCIEAFHMQVVKECSKTSDVVCRCMDGFFCSEYSSGQCVQCEKNKAHSPTTRPTTTSTTLLRPATKPNSQQALANSTVCILFVVLFAVILIFIFLALHLCRPKRKECFKKLVKQCSRANQKGDIATTSSQISEPIKTVHPQEVHPHTPTSTCSVSDCPTSQPASTELPLPSAGNLGPLHIYGAGTVFVSLLNQFGLNGGEKDDEDLFQRSLNKTELHSPTSPIPLSTEERNRDSGYISFPSQEQGKECHMSKEEGL